MNAHEKYLSLPSGNEEEIKARNNFYEACSILMDQQLRVELKSFMKPTTDVDFLEIYCIYHELEKGEIFEGASL